MSSSFTGVAGAVILLSAAFSSLSAQILTLQDGTPVRLRLMENVSSADAHEGQTVDFEVSEPVLNQGLVVIPKGAVALGKVTKSRPKHRFGRGGELEISVDSVRLADGSRAPLRASEEKGPGSVGGARLAATIAASPLLVWVKGKDVAFQKGAEATAYISGDARLDEAQLRRQVASPSTALPAAAVSESSADRGIPDRVLTNRDIIDMRKAGLSDDVILTKVRNSSSDFRTGPNDLIKLKEAGVDDSIITMMVQKSGER